MENVQRDWLPMGIIKSIQCSFVIKHVFWHRKLSEYIYICIYVHCTMYMYTVHRHNSNTYTRWCYVYYIWEDKCFMPSSSSIPNLYFRTIVLVVMKAMTNKKKQFYMYGWNKWYKLFVKCCNFLLLQSETAVLNIDGSHQWKLTVRTNDLKWFRWRKKYTRNHIEDNFSLL